MTRDRAYQLRAMIELAAASLPDDDALQAVELFPAYEIGRQYAAGDRLRSGDKLYKVIQPHTSQSDWPPDATPALYVEVAPPGTIPVWRQPTGAQDAYNTGDRVHYPDAAGPVYESTIDGNVWSPETYPAGWRAV